MKKPFIYGLFSILLAVSSCDKKTNASSQIDETKVQEAEARNEQVGKFPVLTFTEEEHDFGTINEGDKVEYIYTFKNDGEAELYIIDAKPSCGCTVPEFTKTPVAPGGTGEIKIVFDSNGKPGEQSKSVTVVTNTKEGESKLKFKAQVTPKNK